MFETKQKYWTIVNPLNLDEPTCVTINKEQIVCVEEKKNRLFVKMSNGCVYEIENSRDNAKNLLYFD